MRRLSAAVVFFCAVSAYAVTPEQCTYFESNGKVTVCHATGSFNNPYVILRISTESCATGHAEHEADFISVNDPNCRGLGCLPDGAPCDATAPCCNGTACDNGYCRPVPTGETTADDTSCETDAGESGAVGRI